MEMIVSAIMGELAGRSISFLIDKFFSEPIAPTMEERLRSLQRLLLRVRVIVEEAEERHITNQAMLQQLNILREEMCRGYYTLDSFRCRAHGENKVRDHEVSPSFAPSDSNPAKRVCFSSGSSQSVQGLLEQVHGSLELTIGGVGELAMFLNTCPRLNRQPYSMYLLLNKCMFSRQIEMKHIMDFLLQEETPGAENPGVLPIIGPGKVGKSTLIEHACDDEGVRSHFSQILCFSGDDDLKDGSAVTTLRDGGTVKHQNRNMDGGRTLIIIELVRDIDECVWERLYSASKGRIASGSKIILASRSEKIASFGTAQALRVRFFTPEAYWYFFKVRTFGSMDAEECPKMASIAMDMARDLNGCFMGATIWSGLLNANFNLHFWSMARASHREFKQKNLLLHGAQFADDPWQLVKPLYLRRVNRTSEYLVILDDYQIGSAQTLAQTQIEAEGSKISMQDLLYESVRPQGKFKVLAWRSHLPPYYTYMFNCEIQRPQRMVAGKKRIQKNN